MGTFLKLLELELSSLDQDDFYEPDAELEPDDQVVGELSEDSLRLYTMWRQTEKSCAEKLIVVKYGRLSDDQCSQLRAQAVELQEKTRILSSIFWLEVKEEHELWDKSNIGVRKGRKVVWFEGKGPHIISFGLGGLGY